jgi:hypothetical protein
MDEGSILMALGAVIPVGTVKTLVTNTKYWLVAAVTECCMLDISARSAQELRKRTNCVGSSGPECVAGMMAVLVALVAWNAEVVVVAVSARDKVVVWEFYSTVSSGSVSKSFLTYL